MTDQANQRKAQRKASSERLQALRQQFCERYPDDEAILEDINAIYYGGAQACRFCSEPLPKSYGSRSVRCVSCGKPNWITAATFFKGVCKIRAWWGTVWLIANSGSVLKASQIEDWFGVALSTAQNILANISFWIVDNQTNDKNAEELCSSLLRAIYSRRSIKTPADARPEQEQDEIEKFYQVAGISSKGGAPALESAESTINSNNQEKVVPPKLFLDEDREQETNDLDPTEPDRKNPCTASTAEETLLHHLSTDAVPLEELLEKTGLPLPRLLSAITMLELDKLIEVLSGNLIKKVPRQHANNSSGSLTVTTQAIVSAFIEFTKTHWHGFARKNVQLYLSMFWYYQSWPALGRNWLMRQLCGARRLRREELVAFVSLLVLKISSISKDSGTLAAAK